jgi:AcrR family transcriptional regulator
VPRLWNDTIEAHRQDVRDAVMDATASLVAGHGLLSVTMSRVAEESGIGRATVYKYFPDVEAILLAWHERHVADHLDRINAIAGRPGSPGERLGAVLGAYAELSFHAHGPGEAELVSLLHRGGHVGEAEQRLREIIRRVIADAVATGDVRSDTPTEELVSYCLHALSAARSLSTKVALHRLVAVTVDGLRP